MHLAEGFAGAGPAAHEGRRVHRIQTATPRAELKEFVRVFAMREIVCNGTGMEQLDTASLENILAFGFADLTKIDYLDGRSKLVPQIHLVGSQTSPTLRGHFYGRHYDFGIFLRPLALWQLFHIPPAVVANENGDARDLLGAGIYALWLRLAEGKSFQQRIRTAEEYLLPFAINAKPRNLLMKTAQYTYRQSGAVRIEMLANSSGLSLRQYERRFVTEIGFTPKLFARIRRFQEALDVKRLAPGGSWLSVAHRLGYFDQMHMVRDFQSLGGSVPSAIFEQIGDYQPWSLAPPENPYDFPEGVERAVLRTIQTARPR
jgi:AraC-like DNA-binding protein